MLYFNFNFGVTEYEYLNKIALGFKILLVWKTVTLSTTYLFLKNQST